MKRTSQHSALKMKTNLFTVACTCTIVCTLLSLAVDGVPETAAERSRNFRQRRLRNRQRPTGSISQKPRTGVQSQADNLDPDVRIF